MSELDLILIHPGAAHGIYGKLGDELVAVEPPLWCRLLASYVRDRGYTVAIVDAEAESLSPQQIADRVIAAGPRLVAMVVFGHQPSASTQQMHGARLACGAIRASGQRAPIIMLGGHVSALPERTLTEEPIDYACKGEGPLTVVRLLDYIRSGEGDPADVPGLVWLAGDPRTKRVVVNPPAPPIDVAELRGDAWDLLPMDRYRAHNWQCFGNIGQRQPYASIYTSLGCPYACSFCCINAPFGKPGYRMRDPDDVVNEIEMLYVRYGVRTFKIIDELFVLNRKHVEAICRGIVELGIGGDINIWAYARPDTVNQAQLGLLRQAGIRWLALGIESADGSVLGDVDKSIRSNNVGDVVRAIQAADINVIGNYIFGLPEDDADTMRATLDLAKSLRTEFANFYSAMAYPGSRLYDEALRDGLTLPNSWRGYSQHNDDCRPLDTRHVGAAEVLRFRDQAFTEYFTDAVYLDMVGRRFGAETLAHVEKMTTYRLTRKILEEATA